MRHILDVFSCIFNGLEERKVDFSARERNPRAEQNTAAGISYFNTIISKLHTLSEDDFDYRLHHDPHHPDITIPQVLYLNKYLLE